MHWKRAEINYIVYTSAKCTSFDIKNSGRISCHVLKLILMKVFMFKIFHSFFLSLFRFLVTKSYPSLICLGKQGKMGKQKYPFERKEYGKQLLVSFDFSVLCVNWCQFKRQCL